MCGTLTVMVFACIEHATELGCPVLNLGFSASSAQVALGLYGRFLILYKNQELF